jgi:thermostable 8-oxoguanine DNA glycosylase
MDKAARYKFVFESARSFLDDIVAKNPKLSSSILEQHLNLKSKFDNIQDAQLRLIESLSNRNMMASVIGFNKRENGMRDILFGYDPKKILAEYKNADELLEKFKTRFNLQNIQGKRSLWRKFSEGIISGSYFMATFKDKDDFDSFIKTFSRNKYTKAALPMLLSKEIKGYGLALACDFLKELGYRDYPKPDVHLIEIFHQLGLSESKESYEVYKSIIEMTEAVGEDAYTVDKIFWLIGSGRFYLVDVEVGRNRDKFIRSIKGKF